ncbi:uncharacterized protein LOC135291671 [Passer domesticus]|uniref:uncharacterized protein LOC135291671 n=1 Tax=Passer domesticus TaxID=48849 RepID=UPI0030FE94D8
MEPLELSLALLQPQVTMVATLGELLATLPGRDEMMRLFVSSKCPYWDLEEFTRVLRATIKRIDDTWWCRNVTFDDDDPVTSMSWAMAAYKSTSWTAWECAKTAAIVWQASLDVLMERWVELARKATKLRDTCRKVVTDQQLMVALDKKRVAREMATHDAHVVAATNEAMGESVVATRWAMDATKRGHWAKVALGLLRCLVVACDKATLFNWNMECRLKDIEAILKGTNEVSPDVLQALVAKVAEFEWLWVASTHLAKDHLLGTLGVIDNILLSPCGDHGGPIGPSSGVVAKRCQKAIKDIPRLLLWWCL